MKTTVLTILFLLILSPISAMAAEEPSLLSFDGYRITRIKKRDSGIAKKRN